MKKIILAFMDHFESYLCQFLLAFFVSIVFLQIILRFLNASLPWTEEIARFAFLWFVLFGACYATRVCALNRVTLQFAKAPKWLAESFLFISDVIWFVFCLILAWEGFKAMLELEEFPYFTPALDWDLSYVYLVFPISFLLMAIRIAQVNYIRLVLKQEIVDPEQKALQESEKALLNQAMQGKEF